MFSSILWLTLGVYPYKEQRPVLLGLLMSLSREYASRVKKNRLLQLLHNGPFQLYGEEWKTQDVRALCSKRFGCSEKPSCQSFLSWCIFLPWVWDNKSTATIRMEFVGMWCASYLKPRGIKTIMDRQLLV